MENSGTNRTAHPVVVGLAVAVALVALLVTAGTIYYLYFAYAWVGPASLTVLGVTAGLIWLGSSALRRRVAADRETE